MRAVAGALVVLWLAGEDLTVAEARGAQQPHERVDVGRPPVRAVVVELAIGKEAPERLRMPADEHRLGLDDRLLTRDGGDAAQRANRVGHVVKHADVEHDIPRADRRQVTVGEVKRDRLYLAAERLLSSVEPPARGQRLRMPCLALVRRARKTSSRCAMWMKRARRPT